MVRLGLGSFVGIGVVTTGTTAVAADMDVFWRATDATDNINLEREQIEINDLSDYDAITQTIYPGFRKVAGSITIIATYDKITLLLRQLTGHNDTASAGPPYTYNFVPIAPGNSSHYVLGTTTRELAIELYRGQGTNSVYYQGCHISKFTLKFEAGAAVELTMDFIGRGYSISAKTASPSYAEQFMTCPTGQAPATTTAIIQLPAGTAYIARSATVTIDQGIDYRFDLAGIETLTPYPTKKREVMFDCEVETDDDTFLDRVNTPHVANTGRFITGKLLLTDAIVAGNALAINFNELLVKGPAETRSKSIGINTCSLSMRAHTDGSPATAYTIDLTNQESAIP